MDEDASEARRYEMKPNEIELATTGLEAPAIFADNIRGTLITGGVAKINLVQTRVDALTQDVKAVHVATIIISQEQLKSWGEYLVNTANDYAASGAGANGDAA